MVQRLGQQVAKGNAGNPANDEAAIRCANPETALEFIAERAGPKGDAADVAIATTFGPNILESFRVWTDEIPDGEIPGAVLHAAFGTTPGIIR